jgi:hypothetical protein
MKSRGDLYKRGLGKGNNIDPELKPAIYAGFYSGSIQSKGKRITFRLED